VNGASVVPTSQVYMAAMLEVSHGVMFISSFMKISQVVSVILVFVVELDARQHTCSLPTGFQRRKSTSFKP